MDKEVKEATIEFLIAFEEVFDKDWKYTKEMLGIYPQSKEEKRLDNQQSESEIIQIIAEDGTFINTKTDFEADNWGNRELLLKKYIKLKRVLNEVG